MKIETTRFGAVEVGDDEVLTFPDGLLGFPALRRYVLLPNPKGGPFLWLQAADDPAVAFVVVDPAEFFADYKVSVRAEDVALIRLDDAAQGRVVVILTVPGDPKEITANLAGPIVLNLRERLGRQLVLGEPGLSTRHKLMAGA
jgi:flagellar assembly factor FliW